MPWMETRVMEERLKFVAAYLEGWSMADACRAFGISRKTGYKYVERFVDEGPAGLEDKPRVAKSHPNATPQNVADALVELRRKHPSWGPKKLVVVLERSLKGVPAPSTAGEILKRAGLVKPRRWRPRSERVFSKPFAHANAPNDIWCADYKGSFRTGDGATCNPLTISDAFSRYLFECKAVARMDHACAQAGFTKAFREHGLPKVMRTDNGPPFCAISGLAGLSRLSVWWLKLGILPERIEPGKPQQNGRHERMHLTLKQATAKPPSPTLPAQQRAFDRFRREFNDERPHEGLANRTPASVHSPSTREYPERLPEPEYPSSFVRRTVASNGALHFEGHYVYISRALIGEDVGFEQVDDSQWEIHFGPVILGLLNAETGKVLCYETLRAREREKPA
jgi:transposase InsO family protein